MLKISGCPFKGTAGTDVARLDTSGASTVCFQRGTYRKNGLFGFSAYLTFNWQHFRLGLSMGESPSVGWIVEAAGATAGRGFNAKTPREEEQAKELDPCYALIWMENGLILVLVNLNIWFISGYWGRSFFLILIGCLHAVSFSLGIFPLSLNP